MTRLSVHPSQAGAAIGCPKCGGKFQVPLPTAHASGGSFQTAYSAPSEIQIFASKKIAAGICGILLGSLGVHKFILGFNTAGIIMLLVSLLTCGYGAIPMWIIAVTEGIIYLTKTDEDFYHTYAIQKKEWF
jgi:TM2 domain-containing membrane protein YozV